MNKIIVASYMGSGSSAATDLLREFAKVCCPNGSYEYIFLHCPNGVFDLEDKLLRNNNAIRSDEAIRSFRAAMEELYGNSHWWFADYKERLSPDFMRHVDCYISRLVTCKYEGFWYDHEKISQRDKLMGRIARKLGLPSQSFFRCYDDVMTVSFPDHVDFLEHTRTFIEDVLSDLCPSAGAEALLLDQLFLPHNLYRLPAYFPNGAKALVVQRDPRDVFALNKYVWLPRGCPVPFPCDVRLFCEYYRGMRASVRQWESDFVTQIWFEDLVVNYDETVRYIGNRFQYWLGEHEQPRVFFDPAKSCANVGVYRTIDECSREADYIAANLAEFLYPGDISSRRVSCNVAEMF